MWLCMNCWPEDELKQVDVCQCEEYHNKNVVRLSWSVFFKSFCLYMKNDTFCTVRISPWTVTAAARQQNIRQWTSFAEIKAWGADEESFPSSCPENDLRGSSLPAPPKPAESLLPAQAHFVYQLVSKSASRRHLIGLLRCDITGGQLGEESRQPVLRFSGCLRVQPSQAFFQEVILETWERCTLAELQL